MDIVIISTLGGALLGFLVYVAFEISKLVQAYRFYKEKAMKYRVMYYDKFNQYTILSTQARKEMKELKLAYNCALTELKEENKAQKRRLEDLSLKDM